MSAKRIALFAVAGLVLIGSGAVLVLVTLVWLRAGAATPRPLSTATVLQRVQPLAQLITVKYVLEKVVVFEDPRYFGNLIPLGENRIILLAHGEVKAGVDFSRLTTNDITVSGRKIVLTLPPAIVTDAYLVEQQTRVLDWKTGLLRSFDKDLEQTARREAVTEIQRAARQSGIVEEATTRARTELGAFLRALGFEQVELRPMRP